MVPHRSLVTWLLVIGLVGNYARSYEDLSANNSLLDESLSPSNAANVDADSLSVEDMIAQLDKVRIFKRSNPKGPKVKMSTQDYEWHIREGEKTMGKISEESALAKQIYLSKQGQTEGTAGAEQRAEQKRLHDRVAGWQGRSQRTRRP